MGNNGLNVVDEVEQAGGGVGANDGGVGIEDKLEALVDYQVGFLYTLHEGFHVLEHGDSIVCIV